MHLAKTLHKLQFRGNCKVTLIGLYTQGLCIFFAVSLKHGCIMINVIAPGSQHVTVGEMKEVAQ